ncbi:FIST C domain [Seminavis robusta]|uniref:FIST C domain n=1 Tax=Seminavis robusta TaxID=568900 RepID=A0A9N8EE28_9STRA|nr:FIST C domain [Seminavis robusta]|eukprot:Sro866_g212990.1 FIST C domain (588) ;mRNA; r:15293-17056
MTVVSTSAAASWIRSSIMNHVAVLLLILLSIPTKNMPLVSAFTSPPIQKQSCPTSSSSGMGPLYYLQEPVEEDQDFWSSTHHYGRSSAPFFITCKSEQVNPILAIDQLLQQGLLVASNGGVDLVYLFVGQYHAPVLEKIVSYLQIKLDPWHCKNIEIITVLGGGVIGGGAELDQNNQPAMTLMAGRLPPESSATVFQYQSSGDEESSLEDALMETQVGTQESLQGGDNDNDRPPSYMIFSDPFAPLDDLLSLLEQNTLVPPVIAGGISVPPRPQRRRQGPVPSIARNGQLLPAGSFVGVEFTGNVGLMAVVAQGCRPVGPTYVITKASGTILTGLSGESAITRLEEVAANANKQDQELIRNGEIVCGIGSSSNIMECMDNDVDDTLLQIGEHDEQEEGEKMLRIEDDFLIRQIMGFQPKSGSVVVAAGGLKEGSTFRFHVRAAKSAREDMGLMVQRAKTERLFAGNAGKSGKPLAAFQFSCVARGRSFFGAPNMDLQKIQELFDDQDPCVAGFFANGEVGPVGIRSAEMAAKDAEQAGEQQSTSNTFLHGFTTVVAMLCDYSETSADENSELLSQSAIICDMDDAWA